MLKEFKCSELAEIVGGKASSGSIIVDNISSLDSSSQLVIKLNNVNRVFKLGNLAS